MSGCLFQKKPPRAFVPPTIAARVPPNQQELKLPELTQDYSPDIESRSIEPETALSLPPAPAKPTPPKIVARPPATAEPVVTPPSPAATPPKPQTIYTAEDRRQMTKELNDLQDRVRKVLDRAGGKNLPSDLARLAADARTFSEQAEQARERDLLTAVSLARRADALATDLNSRLP
jgi:hypothetical protein